MRLPHSDRRRPDRRHVALRQLALALGLVSIGAAPLALARAPEHAEKAPSVHSVESTTPVFTMDQVYKSMFGPIDYDRILLSQEPIQARKKRPEIVWITGLRARIIDAEGKPQSPEYFCHSNLRLASVQPVNRMRLLGREKPNKRKMFTLVQGHTEILFPPGFGIPALSNDTFGSQVMVMNPTQPEEPVQVRVESQLDFVRSADVESEMKPYLPLDAQLVSLQHRLLRAARAFLDPELQLGRMTPEQALGILRRDVVISEALAEQEVERYTVRKPGQATSYFCGYSRYLELRADAESLLGESFDRQTFNDLILSQGLLPPTLMKKYVLEELSYQPAASAAEE
jgi:hypothetical protein